MSALDRWYRLQSSPFGRGAATSSGIGTPQMNGFAAGQNQLAEAYRQGARNLRRASRRGDYRASLNEIALRKDAMQSGFNPSGIIDHDTKNAGIMSTADRMLNDAEKMGNGASVLDSVKTPPDVAATPLGPAAPTDNQALVSAAGMFDLQPDSRSRLGYRRAIDRSLGAATSQGEIDALRSDAADTGVSADAFNNRARWWAAKRPIPGTAPASTPDYGLRPDGTKKGSGWLGELKLPDGSVATEYTMQSDAVKQNGNRIDFPTLVPGLTPDEVNLMTSDIIPNKREIPEAIIQKAIAHANSRLGRGESVYAPSANPRKRTRRF